MALRQVRGIYPGLLDQVKPGIMVVNTLDNLPPQGKVTRSGLIVAPISSDVQGDGDPIVSGVSGHAVTEPVTMTPIGMETRQAAQQDTRALPWWLLLPLAAIALL